MRSNSLSTKGAREYANGQFVAVRFVVMFDRLLIENWPKGKSFGASVHELF